MSVTPDIIREHFETDLSDDALNRIIAAENAEIVARYGDNTALTEQYNFMVNGHRTLVNRVWTQQKIGAVTSVKEGPTLKPADLTTLVEGTDYLMINEGRAVERQDRCFDTRVEVVYTPLSDEARRDMVTIDLSKLTIQFNALDEEEVGDWDGTYLEYQNSRESILSTLSAGRRAYA